ncbi:hypothetical protein B9Z19DRAFT_1134509 [Tuber borchii]|uniref:Fatty acid synthase beta subunit AflB /Fas1-like central domain-containing protein n=1 Tax=Tuber borchii TaxID=42251 RepID=A0A2T6ZE51_TUBBO|nr:hypothetical protein B9Z19DRAFT_1134509 [Tuber borchii]
MDVERTFFSVNESHASLSVGKSISEVEGLDDSDLDKIYKGPASSAVTIRPETGEPIYKLAAHAVRF